MSKVHQKEGDRHRTNSLMQVLEIHSKVATKGQGHNTTELIHTIELREGLRKKHWGSCGRKGDTLVMDVMMELCWGKIITNPVVNHKISIHRKTFKIKYHWKGQE